MMGTLYIDRPGLELRDDSGSLAVYQDGQRHSAVPARLLERVVIRARTRLDSSALATLAEAGVAVLILGGRSGNRVAHVLGASHNDARARIAQCQRVGEEPYAAAWCRRLLAAKLRSQARLVDRACAERPDLRKPLTDSSERVKHLLCQLEDTHDVASLRGLEGAAAAAYFSGYVRLFPASLGFTARRRRPPPDPVNAALSLGYTLLVSEGVRACWQSGLDPMVGFMHVPAHGRPSMACDLAEVWRARIDAWVWAQFRTRTLREEHFGREGSGACLLGKAGRGHFYAAWQGIQRPLSRALRRHALAVSRALVLGENSTFMQDSAAEEDGVPW
jgi:CRISPR-associated protein Cas1